MNSKVKNIVLTVAALVLYAGFVVGMGFIWNSFWAIDKNTSIIYWGSKIIVIVMVSLFAVLMLFSKTDKGTTALQLFCSFMLTLLPLILRGLCMIPVAGKYLAVILGFIIIALYFVFMLMFQGYSKGEGNKKI